MFQWKQLVLPLVGMLVLGALSGMKILPGEVVVAFIMGVVLPSPALRGNGTLRTLPAKEIE